MLMIGPPGSGKTMLARRLPTILPKMSLDEALETTKIHSVAGVLALGESLVARRPFRAPHHTISDAGLIGGGSYPRPGEVSLAHGGVLFLDELPEFRKNVLEVLRQPMEDGVVTIARAAMSLSYPARFMLAAAMNPCPCGYFGDPQHNCSCGPLGVQRYLARVSGPLLDRIDIHLEVPAVKYRALVEQGGGEPSAAVRERVDRARTVQRERFSKRPGIYANAHMAPRDLRAFCRVSDDADALLRTAITRLGLSARAYHRILKIARTIADLDGAAGLQPKHVSEAIQYRSLDRRGVGGGVRRTSTRGSPIVARTCASTMSGVSPGRIRKFTTPRADEGRTLSFTPACNMVGAVVVRSIALPSGVAPSRPAMSPPNSQRFATARRSGKASSGPT